MNLKSLVNTGPGVPLSLSIFKNDTKLTTTCTKNGLSACFVIQGLSQLYINCIFEELLTKKMWLQINQKENETKAIIPFIECSKIDNTTALFSDLFAPHPQTKTTFLIAVTENYLFFSRVVYHFYSLWCKYERDWSTIKHFPICIWASHKFWLELLFLWDPIAWWDVQNRTMKL